MAEITEALINDYEEQILDLQDRVANHAADKVELRARLREVEAERDDVRAQLDRMYEAFNDCGAEVAALRKDRAWEVNRANEAARLSANARDDADALNKVIADLREQVEIVERDRLDNDAWAVNVVVEHGIEHPPGEELAAIAKYLRKSVAELTAWRHNVLTLSDEEADALRALLSLVHYDDLAMSWLAKVPMALRSAGPLVDTEANAEVSRLRVELEATQDDRDELRAQAKDMAARLKELHDFAEVWANGSTISLAAAGRIVLKVLDGAS